MWRRELYGLVDMSEKLAKCCDRLKDEIKTAESYVADAGHHVGSAAEHGVDGLESRLHDAVVRCEEKRGQATEAAGRVRHFLEEKTGGAIVKFEDWKTDREIAKIENHADELEQHAVDAIVVAAHALLEAEVAIVDALRARKMAIEVAG